MLFVVVRIVVGPVFVAVPTDCVFIGVENEVGRELLTGVGRDAETLCCVADGGRF